jgi:hypothetical protein
MPPVDSSMEWLEVALSFIFSVVMISPLGVIIGGKFLAPILPLTIGSAQLFRIRVPMLLDIQATNQEVILGFAGYMATLFFMGVFAGVEAHIFFREHFGVDPGHFNSLCALSGFGVVIWSLLLFVLVLVLSKARQVASDPVRREHEQLVNDIRKRAEGGNGGSG